VKKIKVENRKPYQLPSLASLQLPGFHVPTSPDNSEPTGGRTHAAFCPARVKGKGTELRAQEKSTGQSKMPSYKPAHHSYRKGIWDYCRRGMGCKAREAVFLAHRTTFLYCSTGWCTPSSFFLPTTMYGESLH